jgi:Holliday junction resolvase RusA-like endonuclease
MARLRLLPHLLAIVLFVTSQCPRMLGQSSESATAPSLDVLSTRYNRVLDTIKFKLVNNSQKAATAYYLAFGVPRENHVLWESGVGRDLIDLMLTSQCRSAGTNLPEGDDLWEGAIKPGDVYINSQMSNLPKNQLPGVNPPVRTAVLGVIWSDGSVETPPVPGAKTGWVTSSIKLALRGRKGAAEASANVVAILNAHPEDTDIQHRIDEAIKSLQSLVDDYRSEQQPYSAFVVHKVIVDDLNNLVASPTPKASFDKYRATFECRYKHRVALQQASSAEPDSESLSPDR